MCHMIFVEIVHYLTTQIKSTRFYDGVSTQLSSPSSRSNFDIVFFEFFAINSVIK